MLKGGGPRVEVRVERGYDYAQVFAPAIADVICFEPMTAPAVALCASLAPGESFTASFSVSVMRLSVSTLTDCRVAAGAPPSRPYLPR